MKETPMILDLEPGTYYWCSCGKSGNIPFCDVSHSGTEFFPIEFNIAEKKKAASSSILPLTGSPPRPSRTTRIILELFFCIRFLISFCMTMNITAKEKNFSSRGRILIWFLKRTWS